MPVGPEPGSVAVKIGRRSGGGGTEISACLSVDGAVPVFVPEGGEMSIDTCSWLGVGAGRRAGGGSRSRGAAVVAGDVSEVAVQMERRAGGGGREIASFSWGGGRRSESGAARGGMGGPTGRGALLDLPDWASATRATSAPPDASRRRIPLLAGAPATSEVTPVDVCRRAGIAGELKGEEVKVMPNSGVSGQLRRPCREGTMSGIR